jgi:hypothetical protein
MLVDLLDSLFESLYVQETTQVLSEDFRQQRGDSVADLASDTHSMELIAILKGHEAGCFTVGETSIFKRMDERP